MNTNIEFIDPNLQEDIEKILPTLLAQALINKLQKTSDFAAKSKKIHNKTA